MMNSLFLTWAPTLWYYYAGAMGQLFEHYTKDSLGDRIWLPFANCIFTQFAINFGPWAISLPHRDVKNLAFGWCAIIALGAYDYTAGGHLVLWDLGLIIEFPPGATILVPSAVVCHSNTRIKDNESRYSFTMFSSGGLFRWVEQNFQLGKLYKKTKEAVEEVSTNITCWARGIVLFSTIEKLREEV